MKQEHHDALRDRLIDLLERGEDPLTASTWQNPVAVYHDPDHLELEQKRLFDSFPLIIGRADQIAHANDFLTHDLTGRSLLVTRGADGTIRAFHNVCRHRGARVEAKPCGSARRFSCPYHAWTYDTHGTLVSIPNDDGFNDIDRSEHNLVPIATAEHLGFIWIDVSADPAKPLDVAAFLGELDDELSGYGIESHVTEKLDTLPEPFNWKLVVDGFLETYHLRFLHRTTIGPYIKSNFALVDTYGPHARMIAVRESIADYLAEAPADRASVLPHLAVIYQIFPNTILVWQGDHFESWNSWPGPDGAASMVAEARLLAPTPVSSPAEAARWKKNWKILMDTVLNEDFVVARSMQSNYGAGAQTHATFGRQEAALQHYHQRLATATAGSE